MTLLERAKQAKVPVRESHSKFSDERVELAVAWFNDEVTWPQVREALEIKSAKGAGSNPWQYLGPALKEGYRRGLVVVPGK